MFEFWEPGFPQSFSMFSLETETQERGKKLRQQAKCLPLHVSLKMHVKLVNVNQLMVLEG